MGVTTPVFVFDADTSLLCDGPAWVRSASVGWAVMFVLLYVCGIPVALSMELHVSPILYCLRSAAARTRRAVLETSLQPAAVRKIWRSAWTLLASTVMVCLATYCAVSMVLRIAFGVPLAAVRIAARRTTVAMISSSVSEYVHGACARKSAADWSICIRAYCNVESGPFDENTGPAPPDVDLLVIPLVRALGKDYRAELWYWELIVMSRKIAIMVPVLFASKYAEFQV
jgi:hypothetical protein